MSPASIPSQPCQDAHARPVLGVILSQFPRYDEAFILRELVALAGDERPLVIFSLRPCHDRVIHEQAKRLQPKTVYAAFLWSWALWRSHARVLRRSPDAYWMSLAWIISRHWRQPLMLLKTLAFFPKMVHFARLAEERGVTHLHAFWATYPASCAFIISRLTSIPYSLSGHAHDLYTANPSLAEKIRRARFVVTCTEENRRHIASLLSHRETQNAKRETNGSPLIHVSYHGVDLTRFSPRPKPTGGRCNLLAVGSLLPCKGFETVIDACAVLESRRVPFHCTIAGGGSLEPALRKRIARLGLELHVTITGFVSQELVVGLYQRSHLFLLPLVSKIHWGIPNVLIESLATKTPVICCDLPSLRELVEHDRSGWIVPEHDPQGLAQAIERLWANVPLRERLAGAGYQRVVERFSLEQTGQALRAVFDAALDDRRNGTPHEMIVDPSAHPTDRRTSS